MGLSFQDHMAGQGPDPRVHNDQAWAPAFRALVSLYSSGVREVPFHHVSCKILLQGVAPPSMILSCGSE